MADAHRGMGVLLDLMLEDAAAGILPPSRRRGGHVRWHVNRGIHNDRCRFCRAQQQEGR